MLTSALIALETLRGSVATVVDAALGRLDRAAADRHIKRWAAAAVRHADLRLEIEGREAIDWSRAYVVMSNHQSLLDIPAIAHAVPGSMRFVAKKELFRIPVFGPAMRKAGVVSVDRGNREKAIDSLREAADALRSGVHIWIAPEGTRSRDGHLGRLKKGGFMIAIDTGAPILPVAVLGTRDALPPHGVLSIKRGVSARVVFGPPIEVVARPRDEIIAQVETFLRGYVG